jgi:hypothetical protein
MNHSIQLTLQNNSGTLLFMNYFYNPTELTSSQYNAMMDVIQFLQMLKPTELYIALNPDGIDGIHHARLFNVDSYNERITVTSMQLTLVILFEKYPFVQLKELRNQLEFDKVCYIIVTLAKNDHLLSRTFKNQRLKGILSHHNTNLK